MANLPTESDALRYFSWNVAEWDVPSVSPMVIV